MPFVSKWFASRYFFPSIVCVMAVLRFAFLAQLRNCTTFCHGPLGGPSVLKDFDSDGEADESQVGHVGFAAHHARPMHCLTQQALGPTPSPHKFASTAMPAWCQLLPVAPQDRPALWISMLPPKSVAHFAKARSRGANLGWTTTWFPPWLVTPGAWNARNVVQAVHL